MSFILHPLTATVAIKNNDDTPPTKSGPFSRYVKHNSSRQCKAPTQCTKVPWQMEGWDGQFQVWMDVWDGHWRRRGMHNGVAIIGILGRW
mmetsp:Transcript_17029/g.30798  ORF Transcript_17029/g.30798 Transcript_17029/m.30798 type:complete len:90 (-) Transcript_17029:378-647(-)